ncbi:MAG: GTP-binding protein [Rubrivivax sp.]|nr:GTP-binding protein [Rubrivivax sp.]
MSGDATAAALPTVVIGGYLGAGKTTLVNRLLRHAARRAAEGKEAGGACEASGAGEAGQRSPLRIAVLVNDFGEVSIDADLIVGAEGAVLSLAGGCVCCSIGGDLVGALAQVAAREPRPHVVLIETSGVGLPAAVARTAALVPQVRVEAIVVVADAGAVRRQAGERYVGSTVRRQLQEADLLLLGKADLVEPPLALQPLAAWLRETGCNAPCLPMPAPDESDDGLSDLVLGPALEPSRGRDGAGMAFAPRPLRATARFVAHTRRFAEPVDVAALGEALRAQGVLRAKGLLLDTTGRWEELQLAGGRVHRRPVATGPRNGAAAARAGGAPGLAAATAGAFEAAEAAGRLVTITLRA